MTEVINRKSRAWQRLPVLERFYRSIEIIDEVGLWITDSHGVETYSPCWIWQGVLNNSGYGSIGDNSKAYQVHRWAYEHFVGPIPQGLEIEHLCMNRSCTALAHIEPVTRQENLFRAGTPSVVARRNQVCQKGHPFTPETTYIWTDGTHLTCRICRDERHHQLRLNKETGDLIRAQERNEWARDHNGIRDRKKKWVEANRDKARAATKKWKAAHRDEVLAKQRERRRLKNVAST